MHIHSGHMHTNTASMYAAAAAEKAAAKQAAGVRKKLIESAQDIDGELAAGANFRVVQRSQERSDQQQGQGNSEKSKNEDEGQNEKSLGIWA